MNEMAPKTAEFFKLRDGTPFVLDLRGAQIPGASLPNTMLNHADFSNCDLAGADFSEAQLEQANFKNAILSGASFQRADVSAANFSDSNLNMADFRGATLVGTVFSPDTETIGTNVQGVDLRHVHNLSHSQFEEMVYDDTTLVSEALQADLDEQRQLLREWEEKHPPRRDTSGL